MCKGPAKIPTWKKPPSHLSEKSQIEHVVAYLLINGYLKEDFHYTPYNTISYLIPGFNYLEPEMFVEMNQNKMSPIKKGIKRKQPSKNNSCVIDLSDSSDDFE